MAKTQRVRQPTSPFYKTAFLFIQKESQVCYLAKKGAVSGSSQSPDCSALLTRDKSAAAGDFPDKAERLDCGNMSKTVGRATLTIKFYATGLGT